MAKEESHINQQLTDHFGRYLEGQTELETTQDMLMPILTKFREENFNPIPSSGKDEVWDKISKKISKPAKVHSLQRASFLRSWAIAATILIGALTGLYFVFTNQSSSILLETYAEAGEIILQDGTEIVLRPNSKLIELNTSESIQEYQLEGEGYFKVAKRDNREFVVYSGTGSITVLGTQFYLSNWGGTTQVYLEEGSVEFENTTTSNSVILKPGESALISNDDRIEVNNNAYGDEFSDWRSNQLIFYDREVEEIFHELEQHFDITISTLQEIKMIKLSGGVNLNSLNQSFEYLALILNGNFEEVGKKEYRFIPSNE